MSKRGLAFFPLPFPAVLCIVFLLLLRLYLVYVIEVQLIYDAINAMTISVHQELLSPELHVHLRP